MMKKPLSLMPIACVGLLSLVGCNEQGPKISLYDASSRFVVMSFDDKGSISFPTYRNSATGEVPYSELGEFFYVNGALGSVRTKVVKVDAGYQIQEATKGTPFLTIDPVKDTMTVENFTYWMNTPPRNNGLGPDVGSPGDDELGAVHVSDKTKAYGELKPEVYDAKKYGFDFLEQDGKCYGPTFLLSNLYYRYLPTDLAYNGFDFYPATIISGANPILSRSYNASNKTFAARDGAIATSYAPVGEESYRFAYPLTIDGKSFYRIMSLTKDHKGKLLEGDKPTDAGKDCAPDDITYTYTWEEKDNALYVTINASRTNPVTKEHEEAVQGIQKIPLKEGIFNTKTRTKAMVEHTYNLLRFQFENFYGIKDVAGITAFDEYVNKKNLKDKLTSADANTYDEGLAELLNKDIDDGHTRYNLPSLVSGKYPSDGEALSKKNYGTRTSGLLNQYKSNVAARAKALNLGEKDDPLLAQGLFTEESTAVIRFDTFGALGSFVTNKFEEGEIEKTETREAIKQGDTPLLMDTSFYRIKKNTNIKNVVLDLTCNGGGSVMAVPYILSHFTDDPYMRFNDSAQGIVKEFHYKSDLNHDGKYGQEEDTYKGKYNFFILTSSFSFSCANFLPTLAKELGVKIIGEKSGGGACTVCAFNDGSGSFYNFSSPYRVTAKQGEQFVHTDAGVAVDYALAADSWYDLGKLNTFVTNLQN